MALRSIASTALLASLLVPGLAARAEETVTLKVMTFNVWCGGEQVSLAKVGEAIRAAGADVVGVQESDGNLAEIAQAAGMTYIDPRRRLISRFPIFDSGEGERTEHDPAPYTITALDRDAIPAWVMVRPGKVVAIANVHLTSDPSGVEMARTGSKPADVLALEEKLRVPEVKPLAALGKLGADGTPVILTGDFNSTSELDWTEAAKAAGKDIPYALKWPATAALAAAGLRDSYREAHPDPVKVPGITWTPGAPWPVPSPSPSRDRIDFIFTAGHSRTVASQVVGEPGGPDVEVAVAPWPADHRAVVSTFEIVPADAPPMLSVWPRPVQQDGMILLRSYDPTGKEWTGLIVPHGAGPDKALTGVRHLQNDWQRTFRLPAYGLTPGDYDAILVGVDGKQVLKRTHFTIIPRDARPALTLAAAPVTGDAIHVQWRNAPGNLRDWVALYAVGETDVTHYLGFAYTDAQIDGTAAIQVDKKLAPGRYELRLLADETYVTLAATPLEIPAR